MDWSSLMGVGPRLAPLLNKFNQACSTGDLAAVKAQFPEVVKKRIINKRANGALGAPLLVAVAEGHIDVVSYLLDQQDVDITVTDDHRADARALAMESPNAVAMMTFLLDHERFKDWSINAAFSESGMTLLEQACMRGNPTVVQLLLDRGADVRAQGKWMAFGRPVPRENGLHLAAHSGSIECVKMMLNAGLTPDVPDDDKQTPIFKAIRGGHLPIVKYLVEEEHVDINWVDNVGVTPRDLADVSGMHQIAIFLARKGAVSNLSRMRNPRGLFARWSRLWVQGDLPPCLSQPCLSRIGNRVFISGGFDESANPFTYDTSHAFSFSLDDIHPDTIRPVQKPHERPYTLSPTRIGPFIQVKDNWDKNFNSKEALATGFTASPPSTRFCSVICKTPRELSSRSNCILFDKPYKSGHQQICYFEVRIIKLGDAGVVTIGMVPKDFILDNNLPGWTKGSFAYHSDDGTHFVRKGSPVPWGPPGLEGDVMGMGIDWTSERVFFTHNGIFLGFVTPPGALKYDLFGCVGLVGCDTEAEVIFGNAPELPKDFTDDVEVIDAPPASTPWQFGFEVQAVRLTSLSPKMAKPTGTFLERQVSLGFEFMRVSVAYGPWIIALEEADSWAPVFDTRTQELFKLWYSTTSPLFESDLIGITLVGHKLYAYDVSPPIFDASGTPGYQLSEALDLLHLYILDLTTRAWTKVKISLKHFPKKPIIDIATSTIPHADGKLWFLNSINMPFFIDLSTFKAYPLSLDKKREMLNLWQTGSAWALIPSTNDILKTLSETDHFTSFSSATSEGAATVHEEDARKRAIQEEALAVSNARVKESKVPQGAKEGEDNGDTGETQKKASKVKNSTEASSSGPQDSLVNPPERAEKEGDMDVDSPKYELEMSKWDGISDLRYALPNFEGQAPHVGETVLPEFQTINADQPTREEIEDVLMGLEERAKMDRVGNASNEGPSASEVDDANPQMIVFGGLLKDARDTQKAARLAEPVAEEGRGNARRVRAAPRVPNDVQPAAQGGNEEIAMQGVEAAAGRFARGGENRNDGGLQEPVRHVPHMEAAPYIFDEDDLDDEVIDEDEDEEEGTAMWTSEAALFMPKSRSWHMLRIQGFAPTPKGQSGLIYAEKGRILNFGGNQGPVSLDELEMLTLSSSFSTEQKISRFFDNATFSDFKVTLNPSPSDSLINPLVAPRSLQLHKAILVGRSQFFRDILLPKSSNDMASSSTVDLSEWEVPSSLSRHFVQILRYLYSDTVPSDLQASEYLSFLDAVESIIPEHLPRLSEIFLLSHLTKASDSTMNLLGQFLFDPSHFADATVIAEGTPIPCHRVILCARSDYFNALFSNSMIEGQMGVAEIAAIPHPVCLQLIRFLYTQSIDFDAFEPIIIDALIWSQTLSLHDLTLQLSDVVGASLTLDNVEYLLEVASTHQLSRLQAQCLRFKTTSSEEHENARKRRDGKGKRGSRKIRQSRDDGDYDGDDNDQQGNDDDYDDGDDDGDDDKSAPVAKRFKRQESAVETEEATEAFGDLSDKADDTQGVKDAKTVLRGLFHAMRFGYQGEDGEDEELMELDDDDDEDLEEDPEDTDFHPDEEEDDEDFVEDGDSEGGEEEEEEERAPRGKKKKGNKKTKTNPKKSSAKKGGRK